MERTQRAPPHRLQKPCPLLPSATYDHFREPPLKISNSLQRDRFVCESIKIKSNWLATKQQKFFAARCITQRKWRGGTEQTDARPLVRTYVRTSSRASSFVCKCACQRESQKPRGGRTKKRLVCWGTVAWKRVRGRRPRVCACVGSNAYLDCDRIDRSADFETSLLKHENAGVINASAWKEIRLSLYY